MENDEIKKRALADLVRIADQMEMFSDSEDQTIMRELKRDYKLAMKQAGIGVNKDKSLMWSAKQIAESRAQALVKAKEYLDDIEQWEKKLEQNQFGSVEYIALSYKCNYRGMASEINLEIPDSFYAGISGTRCHKARKNLVMQQQLQAYPNLECGLIRYGLELCKGREAKTEFFNKYAVPYNERLKNKRAD